MLAAEQKSKSTDILICFSFLQCSTSLPSLLCRATNPFQTPATQAIPDQALVRLSVEMVLQLQGLIEFTHL